MQAGYRVGQFVLERRLGEGGMAEVWLGRNVHLGSLAAVKFLNDQYASRKDIEERFLNEGRRQGALDHPNIVKVYGFDYADGRSFLIMQFVDGEALDLRLHRSGPMSPEQAMPIANGALQGLEFAHSRQIVHRDVKPSNILIDSHGAAYLGDFGIVLAINEKRLTQTGTVMGTPHYMSPEQIARPMEVDHRSDIYSFGCVLYEMLTGATPFDHVGGAPGDTDFAVKMAHLQMPPVSPRQRNPRISEPLAQVILRCLAKDPAHRYANCTQLRAALAQAMSGGAPPPAPKPTPVWPWLAGLAVLAAGGVGLWPRQPVVESFTATPSIVSPGQSTLLSWKVSNAREVEIAGLGKQAPSGTVYVKPSSTTLYALTGRNWWKRAGRDLPITVSMAVEIRKFELKPTTVLANQPATLSWEVIGANEVTIGGTKMAHSGTSEVRVNQTSSYTLRATAPDGTFVTERRVLEVLPSSTAKPVPALPQILSFEFSPAIVKTGGASELRWNVTGATKVTIADRVVNPRGTLPLTRLDRDLSPVLVAIGPGGRVTRTAELKVVRTATPPPNPLPSPTGLQVRVLRYENLVSNGNPYVNIYFDVPGAVRIVIQPEAGPVSVPRGTVSVFPKGPTTYTLTAYGPNGETVSRSLAVTPPATRASASWQVQHHHISNNVAYCSGVLSARAGRLIFESQTSNDGFDVPFAEVLEVKANRYSLGAYKTFHVKTANRNYNFAPQASLDRVVAEINTAIH